jgi:solute carrier family 26 (sodium-independent sulfate anion transporter), member 11
LKAIILDFSAVNNIDLTSVQTLLDVRSQLDKHAAPRRVQWHFASIQNRWTKRGLAAAGFGYPSSFETADGTPEHFKPIYSLAEMEGAGNIVEDQGASSSKAKALRRAGVIGDIEMVNYTSLGKKIDMKETEGQAARMSPLYGINTPFFHPDIQSALASAIAMEEFHVALGNESQDP